MSIVYHVRLKLAQMVKLNTVKPNRGVLLLFATINGVKRTVVPQVKLSKISQVNAQVTSPTHR